MKRIGIETDITQRVRQPHKIEITNMETGTTQ